MTTSGEDMKKKNHHVGVDQTGISVMGWSPGALVWFPAMQLEKKNG